MIAATMVVATLPVTDLDRAKEFYGTPSSKNSPATVSSSSTTPTDL